MSTLVLPGSFDPFTFGHLDLLTRSCAIADRVIVAISHNPSKSGLLTLEQRRTVIDRTITESGLGEVARTAVLPRGLLVDFCQEQGAHAVVRGLRGSADLAYEEPMIRMNLHLAGIDTLLLLTDARYAHISSSLVREVAQLGGDTSDMLPPAAKDALFAALAGREK